MELTPERLAGLRRIAEAATPGKWYAKDGENHWQLFAEQFGGEGHPVQLLKAPKHSTPYAEYWPNEADAKFIPAFDPPTVLALLDAAQERDALKVQFDAISIAERQATENSQGLALRVLELTQERADARGDDERQG